MYNNEVILGSQRNELNPLLAKPPLGRPLTRCYTNPFNPSETFGQSYNFIDGGVPAALNHFTKSVQKPHKQQGYQKDFIALNRDAAVAGLVSADQQTEYRTTHEVLRSRPICRSAKDNRTLKNPKKMAPDFMTFGVPTRPSTPVYDLIENRYQDRWIQAIRNAEIVQREQEKQARKLVNSGQIHDTRTSLMRKHIVKIDDPKLWQMPKWSKVQPCLDTFPTLSSKTRSSKHAAIDNIGRQGRHTHGAYIQARN